MNNEKKKYCIKPPYSVKFDLLYPNFDWSFIARFNRLPGTGDSNSKLHKDTKDLLDYYLENISFPNYMPNLFFLHSALSSLKAPPPLLDQCQKCLHLISAKSMPDENKNYYYPTFSPASSPASSIGEGYLQQMLQSVLDIEALVLKTDKEFKQLHQQCKKFLSTIGLSETDTIYQIEAVNTPSTKLDSVNLSLLNCTAINEKIVSCIADLCSYVKTNTLESLLIDPQLHQEETALKELERVCHNYFIICVIQKSFDETLRLDFISHFESNGYSTQSSFKSTPHRLGAKRYDNKESAQEACKKIKNCAILEYSQESLVGYEIYSDQQTPSSLYLNNLINKAVSIKERKNLISTTPESTNKDLKKEKHKI